MQPTNSISTLTTFGAIVAALILVIFLVRKTSAKSNSVEWKWSRSVLNIHMSDEGELSIDGHSFQNLTGNPPFFMAEAKGRSVVMVKKNDANIETIIVFNRNDGTICEYPVSGFHSLGSEIGMSGLGGGWEHIESIDENQIVIRQRHAGVVIRYLLSRQTGILRREL